MSRNQLVWRTRHAVCLTVLLAFTGMLTGCGSNVEPTRQASPASAPAKPATPVLQQSSLTPEPEPVDEPVTPGHAESNDTVGDNDTANLNNTEPDTPIKPGNPAESGYPANAPRTLANLMEGELPDDHDLIRPAPYTPLQVDDDRVLAQGTGIRKLEGKHLTLYTDLESTPATDALPDLFDKAFPQWCEYFGLDPIELADWRMTGVLARDRTQFLRLGLIPRSVAWFKHGYSIGPDFWMSEQPCDWRNGQLMLHEGTHGFMNCNMGSCGPPWYMEGLAELLSTYRLDDDGQLTMNYMPKNRDEAPYWGRIKLIREAFAGYEARSANDVLRIAGQEITETEDYAWCWALAYLLDRHPKYRDRFQAMNEHVRRRTFTDRFLGSMGDDWHQFEDEWLLFLAELDFNHDVRATAIDFTPGTKTVEGEPLKFQVESTRGWQNSGIRVQAGIEYEFAAVGRYQVDDQPKPWISEPDGVTIRYHHGWPYGVLLAGIRPDGPTTEDNGGGLMNPIAVGSRTKITPEQNGTLFFRINDTPGELDDNQGHLTVGIRLAQ